MDSWRVMKQVGMRYIVAACLLLIIFTVNSHAQLYSGFIDPQRAATNWTSAGVVGGIPTPGHTCNNETTATSLANLNAHIVTCSGTSSAGNIGVINLAAGTYNYAGAINMKSFVVLKGAGMSTILSITSTSGSNWIFGGGQGLLVFISGWGGWSDGVPPQEGTGGNAIDWLGTNGSSGVYTKGATVLDLSSTPSGLAAGDQLVCYQLNESSASLPKAGFWISDKTDNATPNAVSWQGDGSNSHGAAMEQRSLVTNVNGTHVTIADPLIHPTGTWKTANSPKCGWLAASNLIQNSGVESLLLDVSGISSPVHCAICVTFSHNIWVKGVAVKSKIGTFQCLCAQDYAIIFTDGEHFTVRDSWIDRTFGGGISTTTSYGVAIFENHFGLIENNIFNNSESPTELLSGSVGTVVAYNYENPYSGSTGIQQHAPGSALSLVEGNSYKQMFADEFHGNTMMNTYFRNYLSSGGFDLWSYHRYYNIIGNVINSSVAYQSLATDGMLYDRFQSIAFRLGYPRQTASSTPTNGISDNVGTAMDSGVWTTMLRWCNYSVLGGSTHCDPTEVPTTDPSFPNAVPGSSTLPASFLYTTSPPWWPTGKPWPIIGPTVTGGTYVSGKAYKTPAQSCFESAGGTDGSYSGSTVNSFTPSSCYDGGGAGQGGCVADHLTFTAQPSNALIGATLGTISIAIQDSGNNICTSDTSTVTLAKTGGTCIGMTLNGTISGSASSGVFTTTNISITTSPGACTLTATDGTLTSAVSSSFTISASSSFGPGRLRLR
jgi:hypothetical protein